jgi:hypothetical protein
MSLDLAIGIPYSWLLGGVVLFILIGVIGEEFFSEKS